MADIIPSTSSFVQSFSMAGNQSCNIFFVIVARDGLFEVPFSQAALKVAAREVKLPLPRVCHSLVNASVSNALRSAGDCSGET